MNERYRPYSSEEAEELADWLGMHLTDGEAESAAGYSDSNALAELEGIWPETLSRKRASSDVFAETPYRPNENENPYNAWITRFELERPDASGLLSGYDVAIKDNVAVRGAEMTCASRGFEGFVPASHATLVENLLDAGGTLLGKTNMDELAMGPSSESSAYGTTLNPHDDGHVAGGSSSGSAAAVAAGDVDLAVGSDTGGSIRIPASYCGVVGLKPTHDLVSKTGFVTQADSLDAVGPIATDVDTAARGLAAMVGDRRRRSEPIYNGEVGADPAEITVGVIDRSFETHCTDGVRETVESTIDALVDRGASVRSVDLPALEHDGAAWWGIGPIEFAAAYLTNDIGLWRHRDGDPRDALAIERIRRGSSDEIGTVPKEVILLGAHLLYNHGGYHYLCGQRLRRQITEEINDALSSVDVLATPSTPTTAMEVGEFGNADVPPPNAYHAATNVSGHPSVSIPCGTVDGLPVGLQLTGMKYAERELLDAAAECEALV